jgi:hypothetical protein
MWWTLIVLAFIFWVVAFTHHIGGLASGMLLATWIVLAIARIIDMTRTRTPRIGG